MKKLYAVAVKPNFKMEKICNVEYIPNYKPECYETCREQVKGFRAVTFTSLKAAKEYAEKKAREAGMWGGYAKIYDFKPQMNYFFTWGFVSHAHVQFKSFAGLKKYLAKINIPGMAQMLAAMKNEPSQLYSKDGDTQLVGFRITDTPAAEMPITMPMAKKWEVEAIQKKYGKF